MRCEKVIYCLNVIYWYFRRAKKPIIESLWGKNLIYYLNLTYCIKLIYCLKVIYWYFRRTKKLLLKVYEMWKPNLLSKPNLLYIPNLLYEANLLSEGDLLIFQKNEKSCYWKLMNCEKQNRPKLDECLLKCLFLSIPQPITSFSSSAY